MTDDQKADNRFKNRRRMAWMAFLFIIVLGGGMLIYGVSSDGAATRIEKLSFLLGTVFGVMTTIVVSYFTSSTVTQVNDLRFRDGSVEISTEPVDAQEGR